jgi:hypothetical protein
MEIAVALVDADIDPFQSLYVFFRTTQQVYNTKKGRM